METDHPVLCDISVAEAEAQEEGIDSWVQDRSASNAPGHCSYGRLRATAGLRTCYRRLHADVAPLAKETP